MCCEVVHMECVPGQYIQPHDVCRVVPIVSRPEIPSEAVKILLCLASSNPSEMQF